MIFDFPNNTRPAFSKVTGAHLHVIALSIDTGHPADLASSSKLKLSNLGIFANYQSHHHFTNQACLPNLAY
jgi:hypothetical protein